MGNICGARNITERNIYTGVCDLSGQDNYEKFRKCGKHAGKKLFLMAVTKSHIYCVKALIETGADVSNTEHAEALMRAAWDGDDECLELLLRTGAGVNDPKFKDLKNNALIAAAKTGGGECLKLLVKEGADVNSVDSTGETALTCASSCYFFNCGGSSFADPKESLSTIWDNNVCFYTLIKAGVDVNSVLSDKSTVLISAVQSCCEVGVEYLILSGADVNKYNPAGYTALMEAVKLGKP